VDDIGWWADGADDEAVVTLSEAAAASLDWSLGSEAIFRRKKTAPTATPAPSRSTTRR